MSEQAVEALRPCGAGDRTAGTEMDEQLAAARTPRDAVRVAVRAAAALGAPGLLAPGLDESGMAAIWTAMIVAVARRCDVDLDARTATKIVVSAMAGVAAYSLGSKVLTLAVAVIVPVMPVAAVPAAMAVNAALNAAFTYKLGVECIRRFSDPRLSTADLLGASWRLMPIPSLTELGDLRRLLAGA